MEAHSTSSALVTYEEAAEYLRIGRSSLYALVQQGRLKPVRVLADAPRLKRVDLDRLIDECQDA
jgi:excisionase family DNA binding protein